MDQQQDNQPMFLQKVRLSFPHLNAPHSAAQDGSNPRYSGDLLLAENDPQWASVWQRIEQLAPEKWGAVAPQVIQMINGDRKQRGYGWGQEKVHRETLQILDGYAGHVFITASNKVMPQMVAADGQVIDPMNNMATQAEASRMYGGCYVNAAIRVWMQDNQHGRGVRFDLVAIQFAADGEPFGAGGMPDVTGMFGQVAAAAAPSPAGAAAPMGAPVQQQAAPAAQAPSAGGAPGAPAGMATGAPAQGVLPPTGGGMGVPPAGGAVPPVGGATPQPVQPVAQPIQGADGLWYDPATGQQVAAPAMPGYTQ